MSWLENRLKSGQTDYSIWPLMSALLLLRCWMMWVIPLNDTTEARYGEMARKMMTLGDWVTPWHYPQVPFWGKPPLTLWLSALSMKIFGVSAFSARMPSLLLAMFTLAMIYKIVRDVRSQAQARMTILVLASSCFFFIGAGTVMMDPALVASVVLCQVSFWYAVHQSSKTAGYLFFVGGALGLLAKGPIALIFAGGGIFFWVLIQRQWRAFWTCLPWIKGLCLMLVLAAPWYALAELRTPGFLNYFIVGEHFKRFFDPGWQGNLYGFAHIKPLGMIWLYAWTNFFPWSLVLVTGSVFKSFRRAVADVFQDAAIAPWIRYWMCAALFPLVFFTFCHNMVLAYAMPALPGLAIIFSEIWQRCGRLNFLRHFVHMFMVMMVILGLVYVIKPEWIVKSQNRMVHLWHVQEHIHQNPLIYWGDLAPFSGYFYTEGQVISLIDSNSLCGYVHQNEPVYLVVADVLWLKFLVLQPIFMPGDWRTVGQVHRFDHDQYLVKMTNLICSNDQR